MKKRKGAHTNTQARKGSIIRSALRCFCEIGFSATTMEDIRQCSGASTGSIYHHFKGKDQLAAEVYMEGIREYQAALSRFFGRIRTRGGPSQARRTPPAVGRGERRVVAVPVPEAFSAFLASTEEALSAMNRDLAESASAWFGRHIRAGELRKMPTDIIIALILGPCMEHTRQFLEGLKATRRDRAERELADAIWRALAAHAEEG
jgi:AcrR family transcriptional regulator